MRPAVTSGVLLVALPILSGCATTPGAAPTTAPSASASCTPLSAPPSMPESLTVALAEPLMSDVTAPSAARAEQFVRAQLHETLVRLDCEGRVVAGLAGSWTIANDQLTLRLRNDARFWNGEPVTTRDVVAAWQVLANAPVDDAHRSLARRLLASATLVDDHTLRLTMTVGDSLPRALAERSLAIFRQRANDWPLGTGSYRPAENSRTLSQSIRLDPVGPGAVPRLVVNGGIGADARDRIDAGTDLLITDDPATLAYAAARPDLVSVPLPWHRTYVLLTPSRTMRDAPSSSPAADSVRATLAKDAVRVEARPAATRYWWDDAAACERMQPAQAPQLATPVRSRIVYPVRDAVARRLAERLLAMLDMGRGDTASALAKLAPALAGHRDRVTLAGLSPADFASALKNGSDLAYVVDMPTRPAAPCHWLARVAQAMPWVPEASDVVPLVETRSRLVARRDRARVVIDWDGGPRVLPEAPGTRP